MFVFRYGCIVVCIQVDVKERAPKPFVFAYSKTRVEKEAEVVEKRRML